MNVRDSEGNTPLHYAFQHGQIEMVNLLLLSQKTSVEVYNNDLKTPVYYAPTYMLERHFPHLKNAPGSMEPVIQWVSPGALSERSSVRPYAPLY